MLGGRSADLLGRRRVFVAGIALFALSSLACALADSRGLLIGGLLTQSLGWQAIFAVNVPLGLAVIASALRVISPSPAHDGPRHFDLSGAVLVTAGLVVLTFGIVRIDTLGWGSHGVLAPLVGGVALLAGFLVVEARTRIPLVPLSLFRHGQLRIANLVVVLLYTAFFPVWYFLTIYLQQVLGYDAFTAGVAFLPMTLSIFAASSFAPRVVGRFGPRPVIATGMSTSAVGMLLLTGLDPGSGYLGAVLAGAVLTSVGMGFSLVPLTIVAMQGVVGSQSGLASGLLNTSRLMGGALGLAVLSTIADARTSGELGVSAARALTDGFDLAFGVGAVMCLAGAIVAALLLRPQASLTVVAAPTDADEPEALAA